MTHGGANGRFDRGHIPRLRNDFARQDVGVETVVWSPARLAPSVLDPVCTIMLDVIDGEASVGDIADDVTEVVGVPSEVAMAQVRRAIGVLEMVGLLSGSQAGDSVEVGSAVFLTTTNP